VADESGEPTDDGPDGRDAPPPDAWETARERVRADVAAAFAPTRRRCPACGREALTDQRSCPHCGASYVHVRPRRRLTRRRQALLAAGIVILGVAGGLGLGAAREAAEDGRRAERREQATLEAAERRRLARDALPRRGRSALPPPARVPPALRLPARRTLLGEVERAITRDARLRVRAGSIEGPIADTTCEPYPRTDLRRRQEADLLTARARYECVAVKAAVPLPDADGRPRSGVFGYPFYAVLDYSDASYVFCKVTPRAGEGGRSLASVPVPPPCRAPTGVR